MITCIRLARKPPLARLAIGFASGVLALVALICFMVYNAHMHVRKVEEDYRKMEELKVRAEAADIAKSQVCILNQRCFVSIK